MSLKPTIVICPGGWPSKTCFDPLLDAFSAKKYDAVWDISDYKEHNPNVQPPENLDTAHLRVKVLEPLINQGKDVALSMHSYGGFYGPAAIQGLSKKERSAKGLPGGIVALIWTASFVVKKGATLMGTMGLDPNNMPDWIEHDVDTNRIGINKNAARDVLYHDLPEEEANKLTASHPTQPLSCFVLPTLYDPYDDPYFQGTFAYIYATEDRMIPYDLQKSYAATAGIKKVVILEGSSHSPHIEQPEQLAEHFIDLLNQIIGQTDGTSDDKTVTQ